VTDRDGQGVGLVRRRRLGLEREDDSNHPSHLPFLRPAVAADRLLHARGGVLGALDPGGRGRDERGAAGLPDEERDAGVCTHERLLECDGVRRVLRNELQHSVEDRSEPFRRAVPGRGAPAPARQAPDPPVAFVDDPVPARSRPWVDAEDLHGDRLRRSSDSLEGGLNERCPRRTLTRSMASPLETIAVTEIDGIPVFWAEGAQGLPFMAGLVFRVGRCDETLPTSGITHLLEHMALPTRATPPVEFNGAVDNTTTSFWFYGPRREALDLLERTAGALTSPPIARLEAETSILRTEAESRGISRTGHAMHLRFGAVGHGLVGCDELALEWVGRRILEEWAVDRFTRASAALFLTGEPPARLALDLPSGARIDPPAPRPIEYLEFPSVYAHARPGAVWLAFLAERSIALTAAAWVLEERLHDRLRAAAGITYETGVDRVILDAATAHVLVRADCRDEHADTVRRVMETTLDELAELGPSEEELAEHIAQAERSLDDASTLPGALQWHAEERLRGAAFTPELAYLEQRRQLTPADVRAALAQAWNTLILGLPDEPTPPTGRFLPYPLSSPSRHAGRRFRRRGLFFRREGSEQRLTLSEAGLTLYGEGYTNSITFADCVAAFHWTPKVRTLWGSDGVRVLVDADIWRDGGELVAAIDRAVPAGCVIVPGTPGFDDPDLSAGFDAWQSEDYPNAVEHLTRGLDRAPEEAAAWEYLASSWLELDSAEEAETAAQRACDLDPKRRWAQSLRASALSQQGRVDEAARVARRVVASHPVDKNALSSAVLHLARAGYESEAIRAADRAVELFPDDADAWGWRGWLAAAFGRFDAAQSPLKRAVELEPADAYWQAELGGALLAAGKANASIAVLQRAIELDPQSDAAFDLERALAELGRTAEAGRVPESRTKYDVRPEGQGREAQFGDPDLAAGVHWTREGDWDRAADSLRRGLERRPRQAHAWEYLAHAELERGDYARAAAAAERAISLDDGLAFARHYRAHALWGSLRPDAAAAEIDVVQALRPDDVHVLSDVAWFNAATAHEATAVSAAQRAFALAPYSDLSWFARGWVAQAFGRFTDAEVALRRAVGLDPWNATWRNNLGWVVLLTGNATDALLQFERALELDETNSYAQFNRIRALRALGRLEEADRLGTDLHESRLSAAVATLEQNPASEEAHHKRVDALWRLGRLDEALAAARESSQSCRHVGLLRLLAALEGEIGDPSRGVEAALLGRRVAPEDVGSIMTHAAAAARAGELIAARAAADEATARNDADPRAWYAASVVARADGDAEQAEAQVRRVLTREPLDCCTHALLGLVLIDRDPRAAAVELEIARTSEPMCLVARQLEGELSAAATV
jgi:zinc protease